MARKFTRLIGIDNDRTVTKDGDGTFVRHLQNALLLALMERGTLDPTQYRLAAEKLNRKRTKTES